MSLAHRAADDCRDVFAVAAALFKRADYAWAARGRAPEVALAAGSGAATADVSPGVTCIGRRHACSRTAVAVMQGIGSGMRIAVV